MADLANVFDNNATTARVINTSGGAQVFSNTASDGSYSLGPNDTDDYYRLQVNRASRLVLSLNSASDNADLELINSTGNPVGGKLAESNNTGTLSDAIVTDLVQAGAYYIRVHSATAAVSTNYTLNVNSISDSRADLIWRRKVNGANAVWYMNGAQFELGKGTNPTVADLNWKLEGSGEFNGDGLADYVWRNYATGANAIWFNDAAGNLQSVAMLPNVGGPGDQNNLAWTIEGVADFNGDGKSDLLWRNYRTGSDGIWIMNGSQFTTALPVNPRSDLNWHIEGVGDFNGDKKPDLYWRNYLTGSNEIWMMNGSTYLSTSSTNPQLNFNWRIGGFADFNNDGQTDIVWRNYASGSNAFWLMNGTTFTTPVVITSVTDLNWELVGTITTQGTADLARNTLPTAFNLGTTGAVGGTGTYQDTVGGSMDAADVYRFSLSENTRLNLTVTGLPQTAAVQLIRDANNNGIVDPGEATAIARTNNAFQLSNSTLQPGTYFIQITNPEATASKYTLALGQTVIQRVDLQPGTLQVVEPSVTLSSTQASSVTVKYTVKNAVAADSSAFKVSFYISKDNRYDATDKIIGTSNNITVPASSTTAELSQTVTLPAANDAWWEQDQTYYIGMIVDPGTTANPNGDVPETDETNNVNTPGSSAALGVSGISRPDVIGSTLSATSGMPGGTVQLSGTIRNQGQRSAKPFTARFWLSPKNGVLDGDDYQLTPDLNISAIAGQGTTSFSGGVKLPTADEWDGWANGGPYYIVMELDPDATLGEDANGLTNNATVSAQVSA